ncbi:MAG: hypothetical protein AMXMBFR83_04600 [Phycisphaerae bacterium]
MSKREIIDQIQRINTTAPAEFLAGFSDDDLLDYLRQLQEVVRDHIHRATRREPLAASA